MIFVGCDWARDKHDLCIMDEHGAPLLQVAILHSAEGLDELARTIAEIEPEPAQVHLGIELHDGALLSCLLDQGYTVYGINPKSSDRARDRYRPSGSKDDKSDAFILADIVRTDAGSLRPMRPGSPATQELRAWVRLRARHVQDKTAHCQRLRTILAEWCPGLSALCGDFNRQWQRDLISQFPLHEDLCAVHGNRLNAFAKAHRLRARTVKRIQAAKSQEPLGIPASRLDVLRAEIRYLVEAIQHLVKAIAEIEATLETLIASHPDAVVFTSLPVRGTATVATLLSAFGQDKEHAPGWRELAARWGAAPVTVQSGRARHVKRRRACDHVINQALIFFAFKTAFTPGCWAADYYEAKRDRGVHHYTALRCLAQRWIKILYRLWKDSLTYDEQLHQTNRRARQRRAA
jgi:transposase